MTTQSHNPDNLTEWGQSEGWRLLTVEEISKPLPRDAEYFDAADNGWESSSYRGEMAKKIDQKCTTYRTREPLPSQPDDDLSYYETELPKVIAGVRRGEKWEYRGLSGGPGWWRPVDQSITGLQSIFDEKVRVRLAPVPVVRPWSEPADVPVNCWLRGPNLPGAHLVSHIIGSTIYTAGGVGFNLERNGQDNFYQIEGHEYSTDLKTWHPCVKPEGGK